MNCGVMKRHLFASNVKLSCFDSGGSITLVSSVTGYDPAEVCHHFEIVDAQIVVMKWSVL